MSFGNFFIGLVRRRRVAGEAAPVVPVAAEEAGAVLAAKPELDPAAPAVESGDASEGSAAGKASAQKVAEVGDLATCLRRLKVLTRSWAGEPVGGDGLLRLLNAGGTRPPLVWCFNNRHELETMGAGLGPDQPIVGMRSLNRAAPQGPGHRALAMGLADHYATGLLEGLAFDRCAVGGNCQSAAIATRIASRLLQAGKRVDLLLTLEAVPPIPWPGRVALLFGRESESHNPFLKEERPQDLWRRIHGEPRWTILPGGHGQYFAEANSGALCAAIRDRLDEASEAPPLGPSRARLVLGEWPKRAEAGGRLVLDARVEAPGGGTFAVVPVWTSDVHGAWSGPSPLPVEAESPAELTVALPDKPGPWTLTLFLCRDGEGPVSWREDVETALEIDLAGATPS